MKKRLSVIMSLVMVLAALILTVVQSSAAETVVTSQDGL
jgi:peptidoglycan hydrolase CwlO-like protein